MDISFLGFIREMFSTPALFVISVLVLGVLFVNGLVMI